MLAHTCTCGSVAMRVTFRAASYVAEKTRGVAGTSASNDGP
ncbi:MAG TPA: hypothetical protein VNI54_03665 [Thermoanaerobaculia bacterium]|nr:hypothetical protein [Thermoanaerobaculia bacterium]